MYSLSNLSIAGVSIIPSSFINAYIPPLEKLSTTPPLPIFNIPFKKYVLPFL